ncbi:MAG TPA: PadR family transcriptional regulator [Mycobacteriales bacterium]|nr:PadR family transcriptional regulator [Mycobacteriales bacterium]
MSREPEAFLPLPVAPFHILVALTGGEKHGYGLMRDVETQSDGQVKMGPGTLYGTLKRLCAQGLVEPTAVARTTGSDDDRRRYYRLTDLGAAVCHAEASRLAGLARTVRRNLKARVAT